MISLSKGSSLIKAPNSSSWIYNQPNAFSKAKFAGNNQHSITQNGFKSTHNIANFYGWATNNMPIVSSHGVNNASNIVRSLVRIL
jgi:hypothetical protein